MNQERSKSLAKKSSNIEYMLLTGLLVSFLSVGISFTVIYIPFIGKLLQKSFYLGFIPVIIYIPVGAIVAYKTSKNKLFYSALTGVLIAFFYSPIMSSLTVLIGIANTITPLGELASGMIKDSGFNLIFTLTGGIIYVTAKYYRSR
ncbi:MAG: hypothetical protein E3J54_01495 [Actinobacteria bacterium]|nr:MAG: hypothetical protein E3J54_01495 [Actinomycetota bacterium]